MRLSLFVVSIHLASSDAAAETMPIRRSLTKGRCRLRTPAWMVK
jgi:hypothetical protein